MEVKSFLELEIEFMSLSPVISIIVPVYHVEKELKRCLDSLLRQSFSDYEIILINDGGNEIETAICEDYAAKNQCIVYRYQTNQGLSAARNTGLSIARGSWIMFVDSDDWVNEDFCLKAITAVHNHQAQMAIFDLVYTTGGSRDGSVHRSILPEGIYPMETILKERLVGNIVGYVWNKIYKKELWEGIIFPVGEVWEDDAVLHEVIDRASKIVILHDVLYYKPGRKGCITEKAHRTGEWAKWVYIQRKKRYLYLQKNHPEMMDIECNVMAGAAIQYARFLTNCRNDLPAVRDVSSWLREHNVQTNKGSIKRKTAYYLLFSFPTLFFYLVKLLVCIKLIKE